jgi:hypothetical protein
LIGAVEKLYPNNFLNSAFATFSRVERGISSTKRISRGQRADTLVEFSVGPDPRRRFERRPDQKRVVATGLAAHPQQPRHVQPREWPHHAGRRR